MKKFIKTRTKSLKFAIKGVYLLIKTEDSIKVQLFFFILATICGFVFKITPTEWMAQLLVFGLILVAESLNTGIEKIADFVHPEQHKKIEFIKDISAGASCFAVIIGFIIAYIIYFK